jgi:stage III sporulation protein AE
MLIKIVIIAIFTAIFINFSNVFGNAYVANTAFYIVYLVLITLLMESFVNVYNIANDYIKICKSFIGVITPVFSLATLMSGGLKSAVIFNQLTLGIIWIIEY